MDIYDLHNSNLQYDHLALNESEAIEPAVHFTHSTACHPSQQSLSQSLPNWNIDDEVSFYVNQECTSWTEASVHSHDVQQNVLWIITILSFVSCSCVSMLFGCIPMHSDFITKSFRRCCPCILCCCSCLKRCGDDKRSGSQSLDADASPRSYSSEEDATASPESRGSRPRPKFAVTRSGTKLSNHLSNASFRGVAVQHALQQHHRNNSGNHSGHLTQFSDRRVTTYGLDDNEVDEEPNDDDQSMDDIEDEEDDNRGNGRTHRYRTVSRSHRHSRLSTESSGVEGRYKQSRVQSEDEHHAVDGDEIDTEEITKLTIHHKHDSVRDTDNEDIENLDVIDDDGNDVESEEESENEDTRRLMERAKDRKQRILELREERGDRGHRDPIIKRKRREHHKYQTVIVNVEDIDADEPETPDTRTMTGAMTPSTEKHRMHSNRHSYNPSIGGNTVTTEITAASAATTMSHEVGSLGLSESRYFEDEWYEESRRTSRRTTKTSMTSNHVPVASASLQSNNTEQERSRINRKVLMHQNLSTPHKFMGSNARGYRKDDEFERIRRRFYM